MDRPLAVAVIGLGKIGLPIAAQYASKGNRVIGVDVRPQVVDLVNRGKSHIAEEPGLAELVSETVSKGLLSALGDISLAVAAADVVVVAVPLMTGADGNTDFSVVDDVTTRIGRHIRPGTLVVYETTLPLGATRRRLSPMLERHSRLQIGKDLFVAFSPERVYSGRVLKDLATYPKIVGGVNEESTARAAAFYSRVLDAEVLQVADAETAEFAKLAETTYRFVNIALADQLAIFGRSRGVDIGQAFAAANTQPFAHIHQPGIGVGGHCIPVYPRFLLEADTDDELSLVRTAKNVDDGITMTYLDWLSAALGGLDGKRVLVLGVCYRADVRESAFSAAFAIVRALKGRGAEAFVHDPFYADDELRALGLVPIGQPLPVPVDGVIVQAYHRQYRDLNWSHFSGLRAIVDGRGALKAEVFAGTDIAFMSLLTRAKPANPSQAQ